MRLLPAVQAELFAGLSRLGLAARQAVESAVAGGHAGLMRGLSVDFQGHRAYEIGDDLRHLDWDVLARLDRLTVRTYTEETRLRGSLILDCSGSMAYGNKFEYARLLAGSLAVLMALAGDSVALVAGAERTLSSVPPSAGLGHTLRILQHLEHITPQGATDLEIWLQEAARSWRRRGLALLITDGGGQAEVLVRWLRLAAAGRQEVLLFLIEHPDEVHFAPQGALRLRDLEGGADVLCDGATVRRAYQQGRAAFLQQVERALPVSAQLVHCRTDQPLRLVLAQALAGRRAGGVRR